MGNTTFTPLFEQTGGYASTGATDYQLMLNYRAATNAVRQVSLADVLANRVDPSWIDDRVVLIGYTSSITKDVASTPYTTTTSAFRNMPGVSIHAQATSQLLSAVLDNRPLIQSWPEIVEIAWIGLWTLLGSGIALYCRRLSLFLLLIGVLLGIYWGLCFGLFLQGLWLPLVPTVISILLAAIGTRLLDQANHSGYAQAIYEQIQKQILRCESSDSPTEKDALESLVYRARAVRQSRTGKQILDEIDGSSHVARMMFDSPEIQTLYDQIRNQAQLDWESERIKREFNKGQQKIVLQEKRIQALINKAQKTRNGVDKPLTETMPVEVDDE